MTFTYLLESIKYSIFESFEICSPPKLFLAPFGSLWFVLSYTAHIQGEEYVLVLQMEIIELLIFG